MDFLNDKNPTKLCLEHKNMYNLKFILPDHNYYSKTFLNFEKLTLYAPLGFNNNEGTRCFSILVVAFS
jgi:hypothetical protein